MSILVVMDTQKPKKLQNLLESVPSGFLVETAWMIDQGIARASIRDYANRGWLDRVERGVYRRPGPKDQASLDWQIALLSIQHIMGHVIYVGGMSSLSLQGYAHYLSLGEGQPVHVYGAKIPTWLEKLPLDVRILGHKTSLFDDSTLGISQHRESVSRTPWGWDLILSEPERAILEAIDELPDGESFHNLEMVFETLVNLRPRLLVKLLKVCRKIKVRRLFFMFADRHNHAWNKHIRSEDFDLGTGDRALVRGGRLHPKYRIMVPPEFVTVSEETTDGP